MTENVGRVERVARAIVGPALVAFGLARLRGKGAPWGAVAALAVGCLVSETAVTRVCPVNGLFQRTAGRLRSRSYEVGPNVPARPEPLMPQI